MTGGPIRRVLVVPAVLVACFVWFGGAAGMAQTVETIRDDFASIGFSGSSGSVDWAGSWREVGESDGPAAGVVRVVAGDRCAGGSGNCLRFGPEGGNFDGVGVYRAADLTLASSATLSFHYRRQTSGKVAGDVVVSVSSNGGSSWTTLGTVALAGSQNAATMSLAISSFAGSDTRVRFRGSGSATGGSLFIDAVEIAASMPGATTTTVVSTTTTVAPVPSSTTTSTLPGSSTSTTVTGSTVPGSSTTTVPGSSTSTTVTGSSVPASPTTTTSTVAGSSTSSTGGDAGAIPVDPGPGTPMSGAGDITDAAVAIDSGAPRNDSGEPDGEAPSGVGSASSSSASRASAAAVAIAAVGESVAPAGAVLLVAGTLALIGVKGRKDDR